MVTAQEKIFVNYTDTGYKFLNLKTNYITVSCHVTWFENKFHYDLKEENRVDVPVVDLVKHAQSTSSTGENAYGNYSVADKYNYAHGVLATVKREGGGLSDCIPKTYQQVHTNPFRDKWYQAIELELKSHEQHNTWTMVHDPGRDKNVINTKWVFSVKFAINGEEIPKARLVAVGCADLNTYSELDSSSPVCPIDVMRFLFSLAQERSFIINTLDVSTAYLNALIYQEICLWILNSLNIDLKKYKLKLNKSIYGLRIARK